MWNAPNGGTAQGVEAMKLSSYVSIGTLANNAPKQQLGVSWTPLPNGSSSFLSIGGWYNCMPVGAAQPDAGFHLIEYLTTGPALQQIFDGIGWLAYNHNIAQTLKTDHAPNIRFALSAPAQAKRLLEPIILPVPTTILTNGVSDVIAGKVAPATMLQQATQQLQAALDQAAKSAS